MTLKPCYFYTLNNQFFDDYPDPYLKNNKNQKRPFYYCFQDSKGLYWFIPCTSRVDKYDKMIANAVSKGHKPFKWYKFLMCNKDNVLLIQDIFPVAAKYVEKEFVKNNVHQRIASVKVQKEIRQYANKVIALTRHKGQLFPTQANILQIEKQLLSKS